MERGSGCMGGKEEQRREVKNRRKERKREREGEEGGIRKGSDEKIKNK